MTSASIDGIDLARVMALVQDYFIGLHHSDLARLSGIFAADARVVGVLRGQPVDLSRDEWLGRVAAQAAPAAQGERFEMALQALALDGDAGQLRVTDLYRGLRFTDELTLARRDGRWWVTAKRFRHDDPA